MAPVLPDRVDISTLTQDYLGFISSGNMEAVADSHATGVHIWAMSGQQLRDLRPHKDIKSVVSWDQKVVKLGAMRLVTDQLSYRLGDGDRLVSVPMDSTLVWEVEQQRYKVVHEHLSYSAKWERQSRFATEDVETQLKVSSDELTVAVENWLTGAAIMPFEESTTIIGPFSQGSFKEKLSVHAESLGLILDDDFEISVRYGDKKEAALVYVVWPGRLANGKNTTIRITIGVRVGETTQIAHLHSSVPLNSSNTERLFEMR